MSNQFPPSSPVASTSYTHPSKFNNSIASDETTMQHDSNASSPFMEKKLQHLKGARRAPNETQYPSPFPSSSTGRSSSPIRNSTDKLPTQLNLPILNDSKDEEEEPKLEDYPIYTAPKTAPITLELDPRNDAEMIMGRQSNACDLQLPKKKSISRRHASISYISNRNQVRLECLGTNGLVVLLPLKLSGHLIKRVPEMAVYEISSLFDKDEVVSSKEKVLLKDKEMTSFVLLKGETILMPFINGTTIDFRDAEVVLSMKQLKYSHTVDSSDDEDDEKQNLETPIPSVPKSGFKIAELPQHKHIVSPLASKITPQSSFNVAIPATPKKVRHNLIKHDEQTPVPENRTPEIIKTTKRSLETLNIKNTSKNDAAHHIQHQHSKLHQISSTEPKLKKKKLSQEPEMTNEEIIESLNERKIDYKSLQHVLTNHLAFSNVQQTPLSQLQEVNSKLAWRTNKK